MTGPRFSSQISLGSILGAIVAVCSILGATVAWGISYGSLDTRVVQNALEINQLETRIAAREQADIVAGKLIVEMGADIRYLRRAEEERRRDDSAKK